MPVQPILCWDCSYDLDGLKIRSGQVLAGIFRGELSSLERDSNGQTIHRRVTSAETGEVFREETLGPFGKISETDYKNRQTESLTDRNGEVESKKSFTYDENGHLTGIQAIDGKGNLQSRYSQSTTKDGEPTEKSSWDKDGGLEWRDTYDPQTDEDRFASYDATGAVKVTFNYARGEVLSFWEQSEESSPFGARFYENKEDGTVETYECHKNRPCERFVVRFEYLSPHKRNPKSIEWRDSDGHLLYAGYYEYDLDSFQNWTHRRVFVVSRELPDRTLYEEDSRVVTYWPK